MKNLHIKHILKSGTVGFIITLLVSLPAQSKENRTKEQIETEKIALLKAVQKGDQLWHSPKLGSNGLACANCHGDASATNPHTFPKYQSNLGKVGTLREMINWCIAVPLAGMTLEHDSDEMIAMESYATYMHKGVSIAPGKDEQHGGTPVIAGDGYVVPNKNVDAIVASSKPTPVVKTSAKPKIGSLDLAKGVGCLACHSVEKKKVGPAWRDVSKRYKGDSNARAALVKKVKEGGNGNWNSITGGFKMPANYPRVSQEDIELMVDFILGIEK